MELTCDITFGGDNALSWIQENKKDGVIDLLFECNEREQSLSFEPGCFKKMAEMIAKYQKGEVEISRNNEQKIVNNISHRNGKLEPSVDLALDDDDVTIHVGWENPAEDEPYIEIFSKRGGRAAFYFNIAQAETIAKCCQQLIEARKQIEEIEKKKVVKAKSA